MPTLVVVPNILLRAPSEKAHLRNGKYPTAYIQGQLATQANQVLGRRIKELYSYSCTLDGSMLGSPGAGETIRWRFVCHTSSHMAHIYACFLMARSGSTGDPFTRLRVATTGGSTVGDAELHFGADGAATKADTPDEFRWGIVPLMSGGSIVEVDGDTTFHCYVSANDSARPIACAVFEEPEATIISSGYFPQAYSLGTPVYDAHRGNIAPLMRTAWRRNASALFHWTVDTQGSPRTRTSATAVNIIDNSSTAMSAATPGWTIHLANKSTVRRGTVPCRLFVRAKMASGTGEVNLHSTSNGLERTVSINSSTEQWWSEDVSLQTSDEKLDIMFKGDGTNLISVYAISLLQYEA